MKYFLSSLSILSKQAKRKFVALTILRTVIAVFDLLALGIVALIGQLAIKNSSSVELSGWTKTLVRYITLNNSSQKAQFLLLISLAISLFLIKSCLAILITKKILMHLARQETILGTELFESIIKSDINEVQSESSQYFAYATSQGVIGAVPRVLGHGTTLVAEGSMLIVLVIVFLLLEPLLTLIMIAYFSLLGILLYQFVNKPTEKLGMIVARTSTNSFQIVQEAIRSFRESWVLQKSDFFTNAYTANKKEAADGTAAVMTLTMAPRHIMDTALLVGIAIVGLVEFSMTDFDTAAKSIAFILVAATRITPSLLSFQGASAAMRQAGAEGSTFVSSLHIFRQHSSNNLIIKNNTTSTSLDLKATLGIEICNLSYSYPSSDQLVLQNININILQGQNIALIGPSGSGKSTLADAILGVIDVGGSVLIHGHKPRELVVQEPGTLSYVPQEIVLLDSTIAENIAFGSIMEQIDMSLVNESIDRVGLTSFITSIPDGIYSRVGEFGGLLSGGQRQRIGIARALYAKPNVLVMDEATSALDNESELAIIRLMEELKGKVTVVAIAHRLSTVAKADCVLMFENGQITDRGTMSDLRLRHTLIEQQFNKT